MTVSFAFIIIHCNYSWIHFMITYIIIKMHCERRVQIQELQGVFTACTRRAHNVKPRRLFWVCCWQMHSAPLGDLQLLFYVAETLWEDASLVWQGFYITRPSCRSRTCASNSVVYGNNCNRSWHHVISMLEPPGSLRTKIGSSDNLQRHFNTQIELISYETYNVGLKEHILFALYR